MTTNIIPFHGSTRPPLWLPAVLPRRNPNSTPRVSNIASVPPQFRVLHGRRVLLVADDDNLRLGCKQMFSARFSYRSLAAVLHAICAKVELHAVLTSTDGQSARNAYFNRRGFHVLNIKREIVETFTGDRRVVPNDFDISFVAGSRLARGGFDAVILGTGDGDLALAIARGVRRIAPRALVYTLSVPETTSRRIQRDHAPELIDGNLLVDESMLRRRKTQPTRSSLQKPTRRAQEGHHVA